MAERTCFVDGCGLPPRNSRGWCNRHYLRWRRHGDPVAGEPDRVADLDERLERGTIKQPSGCWEWTCSKSSSGYGQIRSGGRVIQIHRLAYETHVGPIPEGRHVCHHCDNPACWRPDHLFLGTRSDNMRDMQAKGRRRPDDVLPRGVSHWAAKVDESDVREMRRLRAEGASYRDLVARYGLAMSTVASICTRETWRHVT